MSSTRPPATLHVAPSINRDIGGPAMSVPGLATAMSRAGGRATVASLDYPTLGSSVEFECVENLTVRPSWLGRRLRGWSPALQRRIAASASEVDIVHSHALWMIPGIYARKAAVRFGRPLVISPRGMLDTWSLNRSRGMKRSAAWLYENANLRAAHLFHATSGAEAESIRRYGLRQPIAVLPNGLDLPALAEAPQRDALEQRFPFLREKRWLLFLGRLDEKKGLDLLLDLWRDLGPLLPEWRLLVAGPDLSGFGAKMESLVARDQTLRERTSFLGMLEGIEKSAALARSELFVLPTRGENFGIAVAEALAHRTPVITTTAAPWSDLLRYDCGWWVLPEAEAIRAALEGALRLPADELTRMGANGEKLVRERLSWESIGAQWVDVYRWLLEGGSPPPCVRLE